MAKKRASRIRKPAPTPAVSLPELPVPEPLWVRALWLAAAFLTAWSFGFTIVRGSDLWWHLAAGRWIVEHGALPATDPWSFPGEPRPWLNHEWLSDVIFHLWSAAFGQPALVYWKWGLIAAAFLLLFQGLRRRSGSSLASWIALALAAAASAPHLDIRPHLYSILGYVLVLSLTLFRSGPLWVLPPLFLVWASLHGGFFFGLMALAVTLGAWLLFEPDAGAWKRIAGFGAAAVVAALINPYGWGVFFYPLKYAFDASSPYRSLLREWQPPFGPHGSPSPVFGLEIGLALLGAVTLAVSGFLFRERRYAASALALSALTLAMSLKSQRFIPFFALSSCLVIAPALAWLVGKMRLPGRVRVLAGAAGAIAALVFGATRLAPYPLSPGAFPSLTDEDTFPVDSCRFLNANGIAGKVFAYYAWGGYLHLCTGGKVDVFIDGRADTVYDDETYLRYVRVLRMEDGWRDILAGSGAEYVLWPRDSDPLPAALTASGDWREIHTDFVSVLLARAGFPGSRETRARLGLPRPRARRRGLPPGGPRGGRGAVPQRPRQESLPRRGLREPGGGPGHAGSTGRGLADRRPLPAHLPRPRGARLHSGPSWGAIDSPGSAPPSGPEPS